MADSGISFQTVKSLLIFFAPVIIPRLLNFYRTARVLLTHRPPPRPLPPKASQALNVLFFAIALFLALSLPWNPHAPETNIFAMTRSRINTPTDVLFSRLMRHRAGNTLTAADELLRSKLVSLGARKAYLRYGPDTLTGCQFCSLDNLHTHLLYYLPFNTLIPHLFHMAVIGLATSAPLAGRHAARWRNKFTLAGFALAAVDLYIVATYDPIQSGSAAVRAGMSTPMSLYDRITVLRPLAFAVFDAACAAVIYLTATNRFFFTAPSQADQVDQLVSQALSSTGDARAKLHASSVTRNAVVRDKQLKERDDAYWRTVVAMSGSGVGDGEGSGNGNGDGEGQTMVSTSIWEEEEVVRAMSRAMSGHGGVDLAQLGVHAAEYVHGVTAGLDQ